MGFEGFRKAYNNYSLDHYRIYQLAYFQEISVEDLTKRPTVVVSSAMEEFYRDLASEYGIEIDTVSKIGDLLLREAVRHGSDAAVPKARSDEAPSPKSPERPDFVSLRLGLRVPP